MSTNIDPVRMEVVAGGRRFPFRVDCRDETVSFQVETRDYRLRLLRWREKVALARFASLGPGFIRDELLRICAVTALPADMPPLDRDVLWDLACWLNEPADGTTAPFDSRALATMTMQLCRAMHLRPSDFDALPAIEVDAMWQSLSEAIEIEETSVASTGFSPFGIAQQADHATKIVIVPDAPTPKNEAAHAVATLQEMPPLPRKETPTARSTVAPTAAAEPPVSAASPPPRSALRFRIVSSAQNALSYIASREEYRSKNLETSPQHLVEPELQDVPEIASSETIDVAAKAELRTAQVTATSTPSPVSSIAFTDTPVVIEAPPGSEPSLSSLGDRPTVERATPDIDALLDELADRVEQAAADMGIVET